MAVGKPRLATHYPDGTVRLYELSSGAFVQLGARGTFAHTPGSGGFKAALAFLNDSTALGLSYSASNTDHHQVNFDASLNVVATGANVAGETNGAVGPVAFSEGDTAMVLLPVVGTWRFSLTDPADSSVIVTASDVTIGPNANLAGLFISENGRQLVVGSTVATECLSGYRYQYNSGIPAYSLDTFDNPAAIIAGVWLDDSYFVGGDTNGLWLYQVDFDNEILFPVLELPKEAGAPVAAAATANGGRWLAVGYNDAGTRTVALYERLGPFPTYRQTLTGIGAALGFSEDGSMLFDAVQREAYAYSGGSWVAMPGAMDNVVSGATGQAVSSHIETPLGLTHLYDNRLADLQQGAIDLDDLRVTLMTPDADPFDPSDASLSEVLGTSEVVTGNWPGGGKPVTGVVEEADGVRRWRIMADDVDHILLGSGVSFRYAVIYEHASQKPLLHIDYRKTYAIARNTEIHIHFNPAGMIIYAA